MPNELMEKETNLIPDNGDGNAAIGQMIREILSPVLEAMTHFMRNNTEALDRLAAAQKIQTDRMEALEKQIRLNTPITKQQEKYLADAIRTKSRELLSKRRIEDDKAIRKLSGAIRKSVFARYGISSMREIPKHEYQVAMSQISIWNDLMCIRDAVKEARGREETQKNNMDQTKPTASYDGS
ncbi:MAG: hypothetical protein E7322_05765 [Clostridiales bacterium]|nr:hypothetical protein [Clostridiales bacterium]